MKLQRFHLQDEHCRDIAQQGRPHQYLEDTHSIFTYIKNAISLTVSPVNHTFPNGLYSEGTEALFLHMMYCTFLQQKYNCDAE